MNAPFPVKSAACAAAVLALAGCTDPASTGGAQSANTNLNGHAANLPVATPVGASVSCIPLGSVRESRVRDDWTIDFKAGGKRWYRSVLPYRCNGLGFERAFSYATSLSQLCSTDIITVFQQSGNGGPRGSCGLGQFQPVELTK
jgi:hypothetical protein